MSPFSLVCEECGRTSLVQLDMRRWQRYKSGWSLKDAFHGAPDQLLRAQVFLSGICESCTDDATNAG